MAVVAALAASACSQNTRPALQPVADTTFFVGSEGQIELRAFDPDGDLLTYSYEVPGADIRDRAALRSFVDRAIFTWTPIAADVGSHAIDFVVSDGTASDRESAVVVVKASTGPGSGPRFIQPLGGGAQLDLNERDCITVDVLVDDPDSTQVEISQRQPIPGSELRSQGSLAALFEWCPTDEQAKVATWALNLIADDKDNPPVSKLFSIIVVPKGRTPDGGIRPDEGLRPDTQPPPPDSGPSGPPTAPLTLDFEADNGGLSGSADWEWGAPAFQAGGADCSSSATPPAAAHSGSKVWGTKLTTCYSALSNNADPCKNADTTDDSILSFKVEIPAALSKPKLVYWQWADFFLPFDWAEVRVDGAAVEQQCSGNHTTPTAWEKREVDLSAYSGKTITIAFHFMASGVVNYAGWYLDDVSVVAGN